MFSAKQWHYWYHFYNVFGMTRSLTGDWTWTSRTRSQHSTTRLSRRRYSTSDEHHTLLHCINGLLAMFSVNQNKKPMTTCCYIHWITCAFLQPVIGKISSMNQYPKPIIYTPPDWYLYKYVVCLAVLSRPLRLRNCELGVLISSYSPLSLPSHTHQPYQ